MNTDTIEEQIDAMLAAGVDPAFIEEMYPSHLEYIINGEYED